VDVSDQSPISQSSTKLLLLDILLGIMTAIRGARSLICSPDSHLSFQNRVLVPSPTSNATAMEMNACNPALSCIGNEAQGLLSSIFLSHNHFSLSAHFRILRSQIPSPPISFGHITFGQAIKQYPFPMPHITLMNLVNCLVSPRWEVQGHVMVDDCCCEYKLNMHSSTCSCH
jgi:hypothetical protein